MNRFSHRTTPGPAPQTIPRRRATVSGAPPPRCCRNADKYQYTPLANPLQVPGLRPQFPPRPRPLPEAPTGMPTEMPAETSAQRPRLRPLFPPRVCQLPAEIPTGAPEQTPTEMPAQKHGLRPLFPPQVRPLPVETPADALAAVEVQTPGLRPLQLGRVRTLPLIPGQHEVDPVMALGLGYLPRQIRVVRHECYEANPPLLGRRASLQSPVGRRRRGTAGMLWRGIGADGAKRGDR